MYVYFISRIFCTFMADINKLQTQRFKG